MKKNRLFMIGIVASLFITGCKSGNNADEASSKKEEVAKNCTYSYDNSTTTVGFTSYKFTKKAGVGGVFDNFTVNGAKQDKDPLNVIQSLHITIPVAGINTKNEGRDENIVNYFFKTVGVDTIVGEIISIDAAKKQTTMLLTMNGHSNMVTGDYTLENDTYKFTGEINVNDWEEGEGITALNEHCKDLHKGEDGISKLWPDVSISFTTTLHKNCE